MSKTLKIQTFSFAFALLFLPCIAKASTLYMDPVESQYGPSDSFPIDIKINTDGKCINTVEINIEFTKGYLQVVDFIFGDSIINLWVDKPDISQINDINQSGQIYLTGGIPGGYCGKIPGDPGESNTIARIIFKVPSLIINDKNLDAANINFLSVTKVFLNDGFGTPDELTVNNALINILKIPSNARPEWQEQIKNDKIPPEPFVVELQSNPNIYNGEYYIDFITTDKQSGIDYYEVLELRPEEKVGDKPVRSFFDYFLRFKREPIRWEKGEIPYLLHDQSLKSVISVRAIDKAGNERLVEFMPPKSEQEKAQKNSNNFYFMLLLIIAGCVLLFGGIMAARKIYKKKKLLQINNFDELNEHEEEKHN